MNKILSILAVVIFAVAVYLVINNRYDYPMPVHKLDELSQKWLDAESAITDMSGTLEVHISISDPTGEEEQSTIEMLNTRYIKFQITDGIYVKIETFNQEMELLNGFEGPFSFNLVLQRDATLLAERNLPDLIENTIAIEMDETGDFWPLTFVLLNHLQPSKNSGAHGTALLNLRSSYGKNELSARERKNGDIEIYYKHENKYWVEDLVLIYRPNADDRVVEYIFRNIEYYEISGQWSGELQTFGDAKIFSHYSGNFYDIIIESTLIDDE